MVDSVRRLYHRSRQRGTASWCGESYDFVCPSAGTYPFQWFWDSCFHAIVLSHFDNERAKSEIRSLLLGAQPDGHIPHVIFWERERHEAMLATYSIAYRTPYISDCMQPPLLAQAVGAIVDRCDDLEFAREVMPRVLAYYDWLHRVRDPDNDGLIAILQADESGLDHSPKFDGYLGIEKSDAAAHTAAWHRVADAYARVGRDPRQMFALDRFVVEDVMVNVIYAENQRILSGLLQRLGDDEGAKTFAARAARTESALLDKCYDQTRGLFFDLAGADERWLATSTATSLFPLLLEGLPDGCARSLIAQVESVTEFAAEYPVPSVAISEPSFCPTYQEGSLVFRGTSWINLNWYLARGLRRQRRADLADHITEQSAKLVERAGFREYYNPRTGEGYGARDFSWSALIIDMMAG